MSNTGNTFMSTANGLTLNQVKEGYSLRSAGYTIEDVGQSKTGESVIQFQMDLHVVQPGGKQIKSYSRFNLVTMTGTMEQLNEMLASTGYSLVRKKDGAIGIQQVKTDKDSEKSREDEEE